MTASVSNTNAVRFSGVARNQAGFNLLELMIVVAIIGILSSLAYMSYQDSVMKSRRKAATACMLEEGQFAERFYTTNLTYVGIIPLLAPAAPTALQCQQDLDAFYTIVPSATAARTYTIRATPKTTQKDPKCGTMTVTQSGVKSKSGTAATPAECFP